jgi:L-arabonate dehydrase
MHLHIYRETAASGTLALVKDGDFIELGVDARRIHLDVPEEELAERRAAWKPNLPLTIGGYHQMYVQHLTQASEGADLDFLVGCRGTVVTRESY